MKQPLEENTITRDAFQEQQRTLQAGTARRLLRKNLRKLPERASGTGTQTQLPQNALRLVICFVFIRFFLSATFTWLRLLNTQALHMDDVIVVSSCYSLFRLEFRLQMHLLVAIREGGAQSSIRGVVMTLRKYWGP